MFRIFQTGVIAAVFHVALVTGAYAQESLPALPDPKSIKTIDNYFMEMAEIDPDFAGLYVEGTTLVIRIAPEGREPTQKARDKTSEAMKKVFGASLHRFANYDRWFETADTAIGPLLKAREALGRQARSLGITFSDVDERAGRIVIGIKKDADETNFWKAVGNTGIDPKFVKLSRMNPAVRGADVTDRIRPLVGGIRIKGRLFCTLTVIVDMENTGTRGFLTNSHCADEDGVVDGRSFKQPRGGIGGANDIGDEIADPAWDLTHSECNSGESCRFSDTLMGEVGSNDTSSRGRIARIGSWGGMRISTVDADYNVIRMPLLTLMGERLTKIGAETGKTAGEVSSTCAHIEVDASDSNLSAIRMICQVSAGAESNVGGGVTPLFDLGDSGSPVFKLLQRDNGNPLHEVSLHGQIWGGPASPANRFYFSRMILLYLEMQQDVGDFDFRR